MRHPGGWGKAAYSPLYDIYLIYTIVIVLVNGGDVQAAGGTGMVDWPGHLV